MSADLCMNENIHVLGGWRSEDSSAFGKDFCLAPHSMQASGLFSDEALIEMIEAYPRERLQAFTMGDDLERFEELKPVDTAGVRGKDVLQAVRNGRLWFKLQRIDKWGPYADLMNRTYRELSEICPGFKPLTHSAVLLLSSPQAVVYFHADPSPNLLFHIRGEKNVWLYRDGHKTLIPQKTMEDIYENFQDEEVPYSSEWEKMATRIELRAGQVLSWPQNTPHRVTATGPFNVSISTFYNTAESAKRAYIYGANRMLRRTLGIRHPALKEKGLIADAKAILYRAAKKTKIITSGRNREYMAEHRIDANSPSGVSRIPGGPVRTEFR